MPILFSLKYENQFKMSSAEFFNPVCDQIDAGIHSLQFS